MMHCQCSIWQYDLISKQGAQDVALSSQALYCLLVVMLIVTGSGPQPKVKPRGEALC